MVDSVHINSCSTINVRNSSVRFLYTAPILIKFQRNKYDVNEGNDAEVCLVIKNGSVLSSTGISIGVYLETTGLLYIVYMYIYIL